MCGIFFLACPDTISPTMIKRSFSLGIRRGPDSSKLSYVKMFSSWIGFHRLAINGLDASSNQPLSSDGCILICNGEIYNYKDLINMEGFQMTSDSDCEVIIKMYRRYGIEHTLAALDGVFAFVLIDLEQDNRMYVARDPFGVRPLFCMHAPSRDSIYGDIRGFASELKPLSDLKIKGNYTVFKPGTYSVYDLSHNSAPAFISTHKYYSMPIANYPSSLTANNFYSGITQTLYDAVKKRVFNTDRPVCCLLSGGLDSSTVAALACKIVGDSSTVRTYSIGLPGSVDLVNAKLVADHLGTTHTEFVVSHEEFLHAIPEVISSIGTYDTTTVRASVGNYLIGKYIAEKGDDIVILNGDGADEVMGGYLYMRKAPSVNAFDKECRRLVTDIHYFDVLRSDRCISSHGLEPRTPFLDKGFVQNYFSIPAILRYQTTVEHQEKFLLRTAIAEAWPELLPKEVLWRRKEAFSDGVSSKEKSWFEIINDRMANNKDLSDLPNGSYGHEINAPKSDEQRYYRSVFDSIYPNCAGTIPYFWMPKFVDATDASARTLDIYQE